MKGSWARPPMSHIPKVHLNAAGQTACKGAFPHYSAPALSADRARVTCKRCLAMKVKVDVAP